MRLAISGTASTGKSTLASALADELDLFLIEEEYSAIYKDSTFNGPKQKLYEALEQTRRLKLELEKKSPLNFISDRCPVDLYHLWMIYRMYTDNKATEIFYNHCLKQVSRYDFIILPPWGVIKLDQLQGASAQQIRHPNPWVQLRNHFSITGIVHIWLPKIKIIEIPARVMSVEERVRFVLEQIERRKQFRPDADAE